MESSYSLWLLPRHEGHNPTSLDPNDPGNTKADPWAGQAKYARAMAYTCFALIALAALHALARRFLSLPRSFLALSRYFAYKPILPSRQQRRASRRETFLRRAIDVRLPVLGVFIFLTAFMAGFTIWAFIIKPYYRTDSTYGSPPLALRSGMMALGLIPFVFALGSKVNFIAMLTGSSHERLQVFHQWASRFVLFLATVHTIPFIYQPLHEGGVAGLKESYFAESINITGTVAFAMLFFLVFSSFRSLRNWSYTLWVTVHVIVAFVFLAFMFIHCQMELTSWRYLWGAAALYGLSAFLRIIRSLNNSPTFLVCHAQLEAVPGGITRIRLNTTAAWSPGQHVFLRFPTIRPLSNHPFTIVSLASPNGTTPSTMVLMARQRSGLTATLYQRALDGGLTEGKEPGDEEETLGLRSELSTITVPVVVDGPYGVSASAADFDEVLMVAGGSGITFVVASLLDFAWQWHRTWTARGQQKKLRVFWSVKDEECIEWVKDQFEAAQAIIPPQSLQLTIHVSRSGTEASRIGPQGEEDGEVDKTFSSAEPRPQQAHEGCDGDGFIVERSNRRANVAFEVQEFVKGISGSGGENNRTKKRAAILVCGPHSMAEAVRAEAANLQLDLLRGRLDQISELKVLSEHFGW